MRLLFFILVLANVGFYAYSFAVRDQDNVDMQISRLQANPEKIKLLRPPGTDRPPASQKHDSVTVGPATVVPAVCVEWGLFAGPNVARADAAIAGLELPQDRVQRAVVAAGGHWVYMPPLKSRTEVGRKIDELKSLGVTDLFVMQDPAPLRNAISLGIFKTEEGAQKFLDELRAKGVRTAVTARRENFLKQVAYFVREPNDSVISYLTRLQREFPGSEIKAVACPQSEAASG